MYTRGKILCGSILIAMFVVGFLRGHDAKEKERETILPVAILAFQERGDEVRGYGNKIGDLLFAHLANEPALYLVDRQDMQKQLSEQELSLSGLVSNEHAVKLGHLTGAKVLVTGSVLQIDTTIVLVAKVIGTETSRVVGVSVKGSVRDGLDDLVKKLAVQVVETIKSRGDDLISKSVAQKDQMAELRKKFARAKRRTIWVNVTERHVGQAAIDPAAETELKIFCRELGFEVIDTKTGKRGDADFLITGEGFSEFAGRQGNLISVKARLEVNVVDRENGRVLAADRQTSIAVDLSEQIAGKTALQKASAQLAERVFSKLDQAGL